MGNCVWSMACESVEVAGVLNLVADRSVLVLMEGIGVVPLYWPVSAGVGILDVLDFVFLGIC